MESEEAENTVDEVQEAEFNVIPVQLVESYESVTLSSPSNSSNLTALSRGKYYKQTYRPAWEQMNDFKGWLRGVEGEPTRAYCTYCHKTLHAHRLSLLKHTCTIRHQKAAQMHNNRKNKNHGNQSTSVEGQDDQNVINSQKSEYDDEEGNDNSNVEFIDTTEVDNIGSEQENDDNEDEEDELDRTQIRHNSNQQVGTVGNSEKPPISTQVMDMTRGKPICGLQVSLYKLIDGRWTYINEGVTNTNGMFFNFVETCYFTPGRYKLHYDVDRYFESKKQDSIYPFIEIVFDTSLYNDSHHISILLSPFGYTTYKGT